MDTGIGDIGDSAEGGDHRLLLVIHSVEAGQAADCQYDDQHRCQGDLAQVFDLDLTAFLSRGYNRLLSVCFWVFFYLSLP